ncbi:dihydrodipicolinate synthase family protein [Microbacterium invictum]|uniref:Dihydrodipicolinate synthase/N-acetylneuraminate lyase n=1 Tax=Microbacterium invictum TaxID=515415 RepID=A0AA40VNF1_9MICO|nr:dihydrodipicolinate synthase family protein [Microbacterium invictum]MBB4140809.1 dihydrodipicolinate synthase/N-acetylneuraminate lyase [Microbacterium invictum]
MTAVLVTPYREGQLDVGTLADLASRVDRAGIHAITALGNTAEVFQLTRAERSAYIEATADAAQDALLVAGVAGSLAESLADIDVAGSQGYRAAMLHEPVDPFGDSQGLLEFYLQAADRTALPLVLYLRTSRLAGPALRDLVRHPSIAGVKYARPGIDDLTHALADDAGADCVWVNGSAESRAPEFLELGLTGFTSGIANARPDIALGVHRALVSRDRAALDRALALAAPIERLRADGHGKYNVSVLKEMLRAIGLETGPVRPPHSPLPPRERDELHRVLAGTRVGIAQESTGSEPPGR